MLGHFGDQVGRKRTLVIALMMMGVATTLIGLLPTYQSIGIAAPHARWVTLYSRPRRGWAVGWRDVVGDRECAANKRGWYGAYAQAGAAVG